MLALFSGLARQTGVSGQEFAWSPAINLYKVKESRMMKCRPLFSNFAFGVAAVLACSSPRSQAQQALDIGSVVRGVDASVQSRLDRLDGYTVTEHYVVFRGKDQSHPAAEMLVKTTYRKESGKSYQILSQSGSSLWRNEVLHTLLDNEKRMSQPGNVQTALLDSANYTMKFDANPRERLNDRDCLVLDITPRRSSEYLFKGKLWVDAQDFAIVQLK